MNNPLVSIVIPVYNGEKYISETIDSVLNQTISNIELIVVNDGSIDNTMELLLDKQRKDTRIRLINKANSGVCSTRNVGIKNSNGTYIAFLDADDLWESDNLEEKIEAIKNSGCKWAYSNLYFIDETNKRKETTWSLPKIENFADDIYLCDKSCVCGASSNDFVE